MLPASSQYNVTPEPALAGPGVRVFRELPSFSPVLGQKQSLNRVVVDLVERAP